MKTTAMNIVTENNSLIAEFMGAYFDEEGMTKICGKYGLERVNALNLCYHTSWDWLMPVIKKIDSYANEQMTFEEFDDYRTSNWRMIDNPSKYDISNVHKQVVEFIKWYNKN